jgi:hypothetical protein
LINNVLKINESNEDIFTAGTGVFGQELLEESDELDSLLKHYKYFHLL